MRRFLEIFATWVLLSFGLFGIIAFLLREYLNIEYSFSSSLSVIVFALLFLLFLRKWNYLEKGESKSTWPEIILALFLVFLIIRGVFLPVLGWDSYALYDFRGRLYAEGYSQVDLLEVGKYDEMTKTYYFAYPPMTSVLHGFFYSLGVDRPMVIYSLFYSSFAIYVYLIITSLGLKKPFKYLLLFIAILNPLILDQMNVAYTNLPALTFLIGSVYFLLKFSDSDDLISLYISALFLAFLSWTRFLEPLYLAVILAATYLIILRKERPFSNRIFRILVFVFISVFSRWLWTSYLKTNIGNTEGYGIDFFILVSRFLESIHLANIFEVVLFVYISLRQIWWYLVLFVLDLIFALFLIKRISLVSKVLMIIISIILSIILFGTLYYSVAFDWWDKIPGSLLRSSLALVPLISIFNASLLSDLNKKK